MQYQIYWWNTGTISKASKAHWSSEYMENRVVDFHHFEEACEAARQMSNYPSGTVYGVLQPDPDGLIPNGKNTLAFAFLGHLHIVNPPAPRTKFYEMTEQDWENTKPSDYDKHFDSYEDCDDAECSIVGMLLVDPDDSIINVIVDHLGNIRLKVWMKRKRVMMQRPFSKPFQHMHYNDAF